MSLDQEFLVITSWLDVLLSRTLKQFWGAMAMGCGMLKQKTKCVNAEKNWNEMVVVKMEKCYIKHKWGKTWFAYFFCGVYCTNSFLRPIKWKIKITDVPLILSWLLPCTSKWSLHFNDDKLTLVRKGTKSQWKLCVRLRKNTQTHSLQGIVW